MLCFALLSFEDISPEEMRLRAYDEKAKGNISPYESFWQSHLTEVKSKFQLLKRPTQPVKSQMIEKVRDIQSQALQALSNPKGNAASKNVSGH